MMLAPAAFAVAQPTPPYYSLQLATLEDEALARERLQDFAQDPQARIEKRGSVYALRVGAWYERQDADGAREKYAARGIPGIVLFISNPVTWLMPDGSNVEPPPGSGAANDENPPPVAPVEEAPDENPPNGPQDEAEPPAPAPAAKPALPPGAHRETAPKLAAANDAPRPERTALEKAVFAYLPPAAAEPGMWWRSTHVTVDEVGYHDGFYLEDIEGGRDLYLPLPTGVTPVQAEAQLEVRFGESLIGESTIRISINDSVRRTVRRAEAGPGGVLQVNLPLSKGDVERSYLKLHFDYTQLMDRDVCFSRNVTGAYTRIAPTSGLVFVAGDAPPVTVQAAWSLLPGQVVISADFSKVGPSDLQTLLQLATLLQREGHGYAFEHIPESAPLEAVHGQIVLVNADRLKRWGLTHGNEPAGAANLRLIATEPGKSSTAHRRVFLMIDRARSLPAADLLRMPWRRGAGAHLINVTRAGEWPIPPDSPDHVRLKDLGFMDSERRFSAVTEWKFPLPYGPMGDGMRPDQIQLAVFAPTTSEERAPTLVSAYLNEHLVYSGKLKSNGEVQTLSFVVPPQLLRAANRLNVVAQREEVASNCRVVALAQPISLSPTSPVLLKPITETPSTFAELVPYQRTVHVYVSSDALTAAAQLIPFLVAMGEYFWPDVMPPQLAFFEPRSPLKPEGLFLVIGDPKWSPEEAAVEFANGRVKISSNASGKPVAMLDMSSDADWSVLQITRAAGYAGAWLRTASGYGNLPDQHLYFEDENVALLDRRGVQMALRVGPAKDYQVEYPEAVSWFDTHRRLRIALFVMAWLAAAVAVIYGLRRARRPGNDNSDED